jgi:hypothetical protein
MPGITWGRAPGGMSAKQGGGGDLGGEGGAAATMRGIVCSWGGR